MTAVLVCSAAASWVITGRSWYEPTEDEQETCRTSARMEKRS